MYLKAFMLATLTCITFTFAAPKQTDNAGTDAASTRCYTQMAATPASHPKYTKWHTSYTHCTNTRTITATRTVIPTVTTRTTLTKTTTVRGSRSTTTTTTTSVAVTTSVSTVTITDTSTATIITSTSTSTVPAPAAFTPVQETLPDSSYNGAGGTGPVGKRDIEINLDRDTSSSDEQSNFLKSSHYPQGVSCYKWAPGRCSTRVRTVTSTKVGRPKTATITRVSMVTRTIVPSATKTLTVTTTSTSTIISVTATTSTSTTTLSTSTSTTVYAACATNNLADLVNGVGIQFLAATSGSTGIDETITDTAYDCCVAAFTDPAGAQIFAFTLSSGICAVAVSDDVGTCSAQTDNEFIAVTGPQTIVVGNGICGEVDASV